MERAAHSPRSFIIVLPEADLKTALLIKRPDWKAVMPARASGDGLDISSAER